MVLDFKGACDVAQVECRIAEGGKKCGLECKKCRANVGKNFSPTVIKNISATPLEVVFQDGHWWVNTFDWNMAEGKKKTHYWHAADSVFAKRTSKKTTSEALGAEALGVSKFDRRVNFGTGETRYTLCPVPLCKTLKLLGHLGKCSGNHNHWISDEESNEDYMGVSPMDLEAAEVLMSL